MYYAEIYTSEVAPGTPTPDGRIHTEAIYHRDAKTIKVLTPQALQATAQNDVPHAIEIRRRSDGALRHLLHNLSMKDYLNWMRRRLGIPEPKITPEPGTYLYLIVPDNKWTGNILFSLPSLERYEDIQQYLSAKIQKFDDTLGDLDLVRRSVPRGALAAEHGSMIFLRYELHRETISEIQFQPAYTGR